MGFEAKKKHAIAIMESKRMWRSNYALLCYTRMESWTQDTTATFCLILANHFVDGWMVWSGMGICMWFFTWKDTGIQPGTAFVSSVVAGICFGVLMAAYHWWRKVVNNLPDWDSLG